MTRRLVDTTLLALLLAGLGLAAAAGAQTTSCDGEVYNCFILRVEPGNYNSVLSTHGLSSQETTMH